MKREERHYSIAELALMTRLSTKTIRNYLKMGLLKGEKIDYIRHMEYLRKNEVMLSELSQKELDQLATYDEYDLESYKFQVLNYDIEVKDALIAEALTSLTKRKRDGILLSYFMGMSDAEIARKMKLVRSTVNEHRKRSLEILKDVMEEKADESEM